MPRKKRSFQSSTVSVDNSNATITSIGQTAPPEERQSSRAPAKRRIVYALVPVALALITSANSLWNRYAADDYQQVLNSNFIKQLKNLPLAFTTSVWAFAASDILFTVDSYYRPIFNVLLTINYALFGTTVWAWHLVNVLIHAAVTLLVFITFAKVTERPRLSLIAASLFAVHPAHSESVAWISGITDPLMSLFLLPAFYFYIGYRKGGRRYLMAAALVFFLAALLSKETALALPLLVVYCELFYFESPNSLGRKSATAFVRAGLFALPASVYFLMRYTVLEVVLFGTGPRYPFGRALATIPLATIKYLRLMLVPAGYSYQHYTMLVSRITDIVFIVPMLLLAVILVCIVLARSRILGFAAAWFIITLAPALAAISHFDPEYLIQERYLYLPSMGACLALALGVERLAAVSWLKQRRPLVAPGLSVVIVFVWGAVYIRSNGVWYDTLTVFKNCVEVEPRSAKAHSSLAQTYFELGRPKEAEAEELAALDVDPKCATVYLNLSYFARASGKLDKSIDYLERATTAVSEDPMTRFSLATIYLNLGLLCLERKDSINAERSITRSIEIWPRPTGWYHAGELYFSQARFEEARVMFEKVLSAAPSRFAPVHLKLGLTLEGLKDTPRAIMELQKYLELAPPDAKDRNDVRTHIDQLRGGSIK